MNTLPNNILVLCTCPNLSSASQLAKTIVEAKLAACVTMQPAVLSIYRWQQQIEQAEEVMLFIKTTMALYADLEQTILKHHPYTVPEIIALPIIRGLPAYLDWIEQCTNI